MENIPKDVLEVLKSIRSMYGWEISETKMTFSTGCPEVGFWFEGSWDQELIHVTKHVDRARTGSSDWKQTIKRQGL